MSKKAKRCLTWGLLPVLVLAVMFGVELIVQRNVLSLPEAQKGVISLPLTGDNVAVIPASAEEEEAPWDEEEYEGESEESYGEESEEEDEGEPSSSLTLPGAGSVLSVQYEGYIQELTLYGNASGQPFTLTLTLPDGSTIVKNHVFFSAARQDTSRVGYDVTGFSLCFTESAAVISAIEINNTFALNGNRMLLTGLLTACLYLLIALRKTIGKRLEIGFLIVALTVGIYMSVGLPANVTLSYDDHIHFERVSELSSGHFATVDGRAARMSAMQWSSALDESFYHTADTAADERLFLELIDAQAEDAAYSKTLQWSFSDTGYVIQAMGLGLGRLLGLPFHVQFILGRVFNMLSYVLLTYFGIRTLKRFKAVMAAVALMPTPVFLSANYSYDPTINGLCFLGIALVMDAIMDRESRLTWQRALGILLCLLLGALSKIVYMPLLLLVLLLPRCKFHSNGQRVWYKTMAVALMLAAVLAMVFSVSAGNVSLQDSRSGGADSAGQIDFLLHHPLTYLGYFFSFIWEHFQLYFADACRTPLAYVGSVAGTPAYLSFWLILFTAFTDHDPALKQRLNWKQRLAILIIGGMSVGMVFTTMYVAFSSVGLLDFGGVQGRYLIPVLPLMYMLLSPDGIENRMNKTGWHLVFCGLNAALLGSVCIGMFQQYFL